MLDVTLHENPSPNEAAMTVLSLCSYYSLATLVLFTSMDQNNHLRDVISERDYYF